MAGGTDEVSAGNTAGGGHFLTFLVDQTTRDILKRKSLLSEDWLSQAQARTRVNTDKGYGKIKITPNGMNATKHMGCT